MSSPLSFSKDAGVHLLKQLTSPSELALLGLGLLVTYYVGVTYVRPRKDLPPGPKPLPFLGNVLSVPTEKSWLYFHKLCKKYGPLKAFLNVHPNLPLSGPIVRLSLGGNDMLLLDELEDIDELVCFYAPWHDKEPLLTICRIP